MFDFVQHQLSTRKDRSAWDKGVTLYALDLLNDLQQRIEQEGRNPENRNELEQWLLNGARDWKEYSWGGCALVYDADIAATLCTPSELKKTRNGERNPNSRESWLDVQARALYQAARRICSAWAAGEQITKGGR